MRGDDGEKTFCMIIVTLTHLHSQDDGTLSQSRSSEENRNHTVFFKEGNCWEAGVM